MQPALWKPNAPIVLATSGMNESNAAVRVARDLSTRDNRTVRVVAVLEPPPLVSGAYEFAVPMHSLWEERRGALLERVRKQLIQVLGTAVDWTVDTPVGHPATAIADAARTHDAALIVMGLGKHALIDRALGNETTLDTLRAASTPLLAVPEGYDGLPIGAVVGVDFSEACLAAAHVAASLVPSLTRMYLVQVAPHWDLHPAAYAAWRADYDRAVAPGLDWALQEIAAPSRVTVTSETREGKPTHALLAAAEDHEVDLIIVGSKGLGLLDRMLVGSTARGILRSAATAVFAFPVAALDPHAAWDLFGETTTAAA